ncbi:MAG: EamA family transporter, partial [Clostridium sp.]
VAIVCFIYIRFVRKERFNILKEPVRATAAILETAGQFFYVFAMTGNAVISAPLIASYSIVSVILSRIFLKEKLNKQQYLVITIVMIGIAILGFAEEM